MINDKNILEPYRDGIVSRKLIIIKDILPAHATGILTNTTNKRGMSLIINSSRAVRVNDVHELACTTENCEPGNVVDEIGYLAFIIFDESGVIAVDDKLLVDGVLFGKVIGFNETHSPNHINIILQVEKITTGILSGWKPGTALIFKQISDNSV
jgi:hypothetical protein